MLCHYAHLISSIQKEPKALTCEDLVSIVDVKFNLVITDGCSLRLHSASDVIHIPKIL